MSEAFCKLKEAMVSPPFLAYPDFDQPLIVETDASKVGVGVVLVQKKEDGALHPIEYASRCLTKEERGYDVCDRETRAVIFALRKFRVHLLSTDPFKLISDHQSLKDTFKKKDPHGIITRWLKFLAEHEYVLQYKKGKENIPSDFLSRIEDGSVPPEGLPNQGEMAVCLASMENQAELDLEERLVEVRNFLTDKPYKPDDAAERKLIRKATVHHVFWNGELFRRTRQGLRAVLSKTDRKRALQLFHDSLGHWGAASTANMVAKRYWWPHMTTNVHQYILSCDSYQRIK